MSNKKNNTRRPAARPDARRPAARPDARPSKGERRREAQHRRALAAIEALAPYAERAVERAMTFWSSEAGERAAVRFEGLLERAVSSAPAQRGLNALLGYAERGLEAEAQEGEARSQRGLAEERVALERLLAEAARAEELEQLRHRRAVAELEAQARAAEAKVDGPPPQQREAEEAVAKAMALNAGLHQEVAEAQARAAEAEAKLREVVAEDPLVRALGLKTAEPEPEPEAQAVAELAQLRDRLKAISLSAGYALAEGAPAEARLRALRAEVAHLWRTSH